MLTPDQIQAIEARAKLAMRPAEEPDEIESVYAAARAFDDRLALLQDRRELLSAIFGVLYARENGFYEAWVRLWEIAGRDTDARKIAREKGAPPC
jgi:hypothetical protein